MNRRHTLKLLSTLPVLMSLPAWAKDSKAAGQSSMLDENDTLAKAMQYRADASKAPAMRTNKSAFCDNCSKYNVCMTGDTSCKPLDAKALASAKAAPCQIFKGKNVAAKGWCLSWQPKG